MHIINVFLKFLSRLGQSYLILRYSKNFIIYYFFTIYFKCIKLHKITKYIITRTHTILYNCNTIIQLKYNITLFYIFNAIINKIVRNT